MKANNILSMTIIKDVEANHFTTPTNSINEDVAAIIVLFDRVNIRGEVARLSDQSVKRESSLEHSYEVYNADEDFQSLMGQCRSMLARGTS